MLSLRFAPSITSAQLTALAPELYTALVPSESVVSEVPAEPVASIGPAVPVFSAPAVGPYAPTALVGIVSPSLAGPVDPDSGLQATNTARVIRYK